MLRGIHDRGSAGRRRLHGADGRRRSREDRLTTGEAAHGSSGVIVPASASDLGLESSAWIVRADAYVG